MPAPPQRPRASDVWNAAADDALDAADVAAMAAEGAARRTEATDPLVQEQAARELACERRAEAIARMLARGFRARARLARMQEDAEPTVRMRLVGREWVPRRRRLRWPPWG